MERRDSVSETARPRPFVISQVLKQELPFLAAAGSLAAFQFHGDTWLGGLAEPLVAAALFAWIPFVSNGLTGLRAIDPATHELLRSADASKVASHEATHSSPKTT